VSTEHQKKKKKNTQRRREEEKVTLFCTLKQDLSGPLPLHHPSSTPATIGTGTSTRTPLLLVEEYNDAFSTKTLMR
jgi:hypothetical protein